MNTEIIFTSKLPAEYLSALQQLMFFNERQSRYREAIVASVEEYGEPQVRRAGDFLRIHTRHLGEVQALFALEGIPPGQRLVGFAVYARIEDDTIVLLHIGVDGDFSSEGSRGGELLTLKLVRRVLDVGKSLGGIKKAVLLYGPAGYREIRTRG